MSGWAPPQGGGGSGTSGVTVLGYVHLQHQELAGVDGGAMVQNVWSTRTLNTKVTDTLGVTLAANQVTLPAGKYRIDVFTSGQGLGHNILRFYDATGAAELALGITHFMGASNSRSNMRGEFTLTVESDVELQHLMANAAATPNMGKSQALYAALAPTAIYADVMIFKLAD